MTHIVQLKSVVKKFDDNVILKSLDLEIEQGEFVVMLGRSGSGKTTILRILAGLDQANAGEVTVPEQKAAVFQEPRLMPWKRAWENIVLGLRKHNTKAHAVETLTEVGLAHRVDAWPLTLSGGEAQRVALARALRREPQLLLLDEPFAALDALTRVQMHRLIIELWRAHLPAVLLVTHDVDEAVLLADRIIVLEDGNIIANIKVELSRPRYAGDEKFQQYRLQLLKLLGVDPLGNHDTGKVAIS